MRKKKGLTLGELRKIGKMFGRCDWEAYPEMGVFGFEFDSFAQVENFFISNFKLFQDRGVGTKVIGKKMFLFAKEVSNG